MSTDRWRGPTEAAEGSDGPPETHVSTRSPSVPRRLGKGLVAFVVALTLLYGADGSRQPTSGNGWRLLGYQRGVGTPGTVLAVTDQTSLDRAWDKMLLRSAPSRPDFDRSAVFWFTFNGTIGCPARFEGLRIDPARQLVAGSFSLAVTSGCGAPSVPDSFLVAIDRDRLPAAPFRVQLADPPPPGAAGASIDVTR